MCHIKHICSIHNRLHSRNIQQVRRQRERHRISSPSLQPSVAISIAPQAKLQLLTRRHSMENVRSCAAAAAACSADGSSGAGGGGGREGQEGGLRLALDPG